MDLDPTSVSGDGARAAVRDDAGVVVLDLTGAELAPVGRIERSARAVAMFGDQLWAVHDDAMVRYDARGVALGSTPLPALGAIARCSSYRLGGGHLAIEGDARCELWLEDDRVLVAEPAPPGSIALAPRCRVERHDGRVRVRRGGMVRELALPAELVGATALVGGALIDGGAAVALELRGLHRHQLVVADLRNGRIRVRSRLEACAGVAIAERAGIAIVVREDGGVLALDLHQGRVLGEHGLDGAIDALSIDADATQLLVSVRDGSGARTIERVDVVALREGRALASVAATQPEAPAPAPPAPSPILVVDVSAPDAPAQPALPTLPLLALHPRGATPRLSPAHHGAFLDAAYEVVAAWLATATAMARPGASVDPLRDREAVAAAGFASWRQVATPLAVLVDELGLSPLARAILLVTAAPSLLGELARPYRALAADPTRPLVDEMLLCQLLDVDRGMRADVARELEPGAPLVRHGLIVLAAGARPFVALEVPHTAIRRLRGDAFLADHDGPVMRRAADRGLDELRTGGGDLVELLDALARPPGAHPARIVLRGRDGAGRRTLAAALAARAGRELGLVELSSGLGPEAIAALRRDLRDAHVRGWIACLSGLDTLGAADAAVRDQVRAELAAHPGPLFLRVDGETAAPLAAGHLVFELPPLSLAERRAAWRDALARHRLATDAAGALAERYTVGPGVAHRIAAQITRHDERVDLLVDRSFRQRRAERIGRVASRVERLPSWDDLVLPDDMMDSLRELIGRVRLRSTVLDTWGMQRVASTARAVTALFQGGPGTGKTMVAGVLARELGFDLYRVDLSRVTSKWIGETEKNLAEVFAAAEDGECVLLFDEADALFARRTAVTTANDRHANLEVNYLLQRLDSFDGIAILTTNFGTAIDPAFKRRLSLHLQFAAPDEAERARLWRAHLPAQVPVHGDLDLPTLAATYQLSGGHIRNAALRAVYLAAAEHVPLTAAHLTRAVAAEYRDRGKIGRTGPLE